MSSMITGPQTDEPEGPPGDLPLTLRAMGMVCAFDRVGEDGKVWWRSPYADTTVSVAYADTWFLHVEARVYRDPSVYVTASMHASTLEEAEREVRAALLACGGEAASAMREVAS